MSISFHCPNCEQICAFHDEYAGRQGRCCKCNQVFTIPFQEERIAEKIETDPGEPVPGFYRAVFFENWKVFIKFPSLVGLVFITAAVSFKFFAGHANYQFLRFYFPLGFITQIITWGCLCWYYMEIVTSAASGEDELPVTEIGIGFEFFGNVLGTLYLFVVALAVVEVPCIILIKLLKAFGVVGSAVQYFIMLSGLFAFPMAVLILAIGRGPWMVLWPGNIIRPIAKAFFPYLLTAGFVILAGALQLMTAGYVHLQDKNNLTVGLHLAMNIGVVFLTVFAMRTVGLFGRHYNCYLPD
jgi:hypothetical protein